jgi:hypothetical protein
MRADPAPTASTTPVEDTVATAAAVLDHVGGLVVTGWPAESSAATAAASDRPGDSQALLGVTRNAAIPRGVLSIVGPSPQPALNSTAAAAR